MSSAPTLWTSDDLAAFTKLTPDQIRRMRSDGTGPAFIKLGRSVRYSPGAVTRWLETRTATCTEKEPRA